jgi:hypothetical protein
LNRATASRASCSSCSASRVRSSAHSFTGVAFLFSIGGRHPGEFHFWSTFLWICVISLPLLFLLAWGLKGSILEQSQDTLDTIGRYGRRRAALPLVILEISNIGPRMVLYGIQLHRGRQNTGSVNLERAAMALHTLAMYDEGISPAKLLRPGEPPAQLEPLLGFLMFHDLADISKTGDRVWLRSEAREKLSAMR